MKAKKKDLSKDQKIWREAYQEGKHDGYGEGYIRGIEDAQQTIIEVLGIGKLKEEFYGS